MPIGLTCAAGATPATEWLGRAAALALGVAAALFAGGSAVGAPPGTEATSGEAATAPPPNTAQPFAAVVASLTDALLAQAELPPGGTRRAVVIDPLIDRDTRAETVATRSIGVAIEERVRERHPQFEVRPFGTASLAEQPLILLGSMAGVAAAGSRAPATDRPRVYWIWAVVADLRSRQVLGLEHAWVGTEEVDPTPTAFFRDSPAWAPDPVTAAYLKTCASPAGTPIESVYLQALSAQAVLAEAVTAYEAGRYQEALDRYTAALRLPGGEQLRTFNGIYLANWELGRRREAEAAFARIVDYGLQQDRLGLKFLFRVGSTAFWPDPVVSRPYPMWLRQLARRAEEHGACLRVTGHASPTGSAALNDRLSLARAQRVRAQLVEERPPLRDRTQVQGMGSREVLVGTGTDNAIDVLDRRVEFRPLPCGAMRAAAPSRS
jgi:outer membrane protein OmpA-like peptidoglycan-associated protein